MGEASPTKADVGQEVPAIPGCATEGDSWDELISNLHEAIEGCLSVDRSQLEIDDKSQLLELAI